MKMNSYKEGTDLMQQAYNTQKTSLPLLATQKQNDRDDAQTHTQQVVQQCDCLTTRSYYIVSIKAIIACHIQHVMSEKKLQSVHSLNPYCLHANHEEMCKENCTMYQLEANSIYAVLRHEKIWANSRTKKLHLFATINDYHLSAYSHNIYIQINFIHPLE